MRSREDIEPELTAAQAIDACTPGDTAAALRALRVALAELGSVPSHMLYQLQMRNPDVDLHAEASSLYAELGLTEPAFDPETADPATFAL